jgi:hypothetical protein
MSPATDSSDSREKLALIWASRRERLIAVRVRYTIAASEGCDVYTLESVQELD